MDNLPYNDTSSFLFQHYHEKPSEENNHKVQEITHTKIGNKDLGISGGSYHIPNDKIEEFYSFYVQDVFTRRKDFYLTEKQIPNGQIMIDLDFRYDNSVKERQHGDEEIIEIWGVNFKVEKFEENCSNGSLSFKNIYQIDSQGIIRRSIQHHSDTLGSMLIERLDR